MSTRPTMRAVAKTEPGPGLSLITLPVPDVGPDEVRIKVTAASICGTDVHIYDWDRWSARRIKPPLVLGHEFAGVVDAVGDGITDLAEGTAVSAEGHVLAEVQRYPLPGQEHLSREMEVIGIDRPGAFAEYVVVPRRNVWVNPPELPPEQASLQDPFGNAVHSVEAQPVAGRTVLITGAGLIGLMAIPVARDAGAALVAVTEVNPRRLEMALNLGANAAVNAAAEGADAELEELTDGRGFDVLLEMSGNPAAIRQGLTALRPGGDGALLGLPSGPIEIDWGELVVLKGCTLRGIYGRRIWETWHSMRRLLGEGRVDLAPLITHRFPLEEFEAAFAVMHSGEGGKVILQP